MSIENKAKPQQPLPLSYYRRHWMRQNGLTNGQLAAEFGLKSDMAVSRMMNKGIARQRYIDTLRDKYGMPEHLLPAPSREKTGPLSAAEKAARAKC